jgi:hypothetical protein
MTFKGFEKHAPVLAVANSKSKPDFAAVIIDAAPRKHLVIAIATGIGVAICNNGQQLAKRQ